MKLSKGEFHKLIKEEIALTESDLEPEYQPDQEQLAKIYLMSLRQKLDDVWNDLAEATKVANTIGAKNIQVEDKDIEREIKASIQNAPLKVNFSGYDESIINQAFIQIIFSGLESGIMDFEE